MRSHFSDSALVGVVADSSLSDMLHLADANPETEMEAIFKEKLEQIERGQTTG